MLLRAFTRSPEQEAGTAPFLWHIVKTLFRKERKLGEGRSVALSLALIAPVRRLPERASSERSHSANTLVLCAYLLSYALGEYADGTARPSPRADA